MAVDDTDPRIVEEAGDDIETDFDFDFLIFAESDIVAYKKDADGVYTLGELDVDYAVSFTAGEEGGTVSWTVAPVTSGASVVIGATPITQGDDLTREGALPTTTIQNIVDKLCVQIRQVDDKVNRAIKAPVVPALADTAEFEAPVDGKGVKWTDNGDGTWTLENTEDDIDSMATDAEAAQTAAEAAQTAAEAAQTAAEAAQTAAEAAQTAAEAAQALAEAAATAATQESSGLFAARPAAPTSMTRYYATDQGVYYLYSVEAARWFAIS